MRAVVHERYGPPDVLRVGEVERPEPDENEVLVRVHASTVTRGDAMRVRSDKYRFTRLITGVRRPKRTSLGTEFAGRIEAVGSAVAELREGDDVFGAESGANAEYVTVRESEVIAPKPAGLTYEQAAAIPDGSLLALSCLAAAGHLEGKRVVVYGAAGSIGTAAVQLLAHHFEADVTAVCDGKDVELVRSLGATHVIDRLSEDFTRNGETYDAVFDAVGKQSFRRCRRSLEPGGVFVTVDLGFMYHVPLLSLVTRFAGKRRAKLGIGRYRREDLVLVKELVEAGKYRPVIDRAYALDEIVDAVRYVERGQKTGNVVLRVAGQHPAARELSPGLWHWEAPHPEWTSGEAWPQLVSSYAIDDGSRLLLLDPLAPPSEILERAAARETAIVLTAPWHERDTRRLVAELGAPVFLPPPDTAEDLIEKFGITAEQAGDGSPDVRWLLSGGEGEPHLYGAGDRLPIGVEAFPGREHNDLVLWIESARAVISGDTLVDFGKGFDIADWLRGEVTREQVAEGLRPLLALPVEHVLPTHGRPTDRASLERALAR